MEDLLGSLLREKLVLLFVSYGEIFGTKIPHGVNFYRSINPSPFNLYLSE